MITADGTVVDDDIPGPERNGVPLFDLKLLLIASFGADAVGLLGHWGVAHLDVGHVGELVICR